MSSRMVVPPRLVLLLSGTLLAVVPRFATAAGAERLEFNRDIRPILTEACFHCHGPDKAKRKAGLRLDTEAGAFADLGGHRAIVPGKAMESEIIRRILSSDATEQMPPPKSGRRVTPKQVELLRRWIDQGAPWQAHWAFIAPRWPKLPGMKQRSWLRTPVDAFVLQRLDQEGLAPSPEADKVTLLRRVSLDLTGVPPTPDEVDAFLAAQAPDEYERVVDRLLASPRYGERMVLDWLDAARYADSNGYQQDRSRPMWPWRDWVLEALNRNMPFDQLTIEQLAGDLLPQATQNQKIATGFNRNHMLNGEGGRIPEESRVDYVVDRVDTVATVWLGLTFGCARCHDHKYDPFTQKEYYQLFSYFNNIAETGSVDRGGSAAPVLPLPTAAQTFKVAALNKTIDQLQRQLKTITDRLVLVQSDWEQHAEVAKLPTAIAAAVKTPVAKRSEAQKKEILDHYLATSTERQAIQTKLNKTRSALEAVNKSILMAMVMEERPQPRETFVLKRGSYTQPGEKVTGGVPASLNALPDGAPNNRLSFARWLVDPANPLTARVTVNRLWQSIFGTGLVKTTEDFGVQGEPPSHPELLDWLALEFVRSGWNVKALHRLIVTSATYRQSSRVTPTLLERDPENRLLARGPRQRLSSLLLRDQALAVSGLLVERVGGPPVYPYQPPGIWEEMSFGKITYQQEKGPNLYRRSLYTFWRRTVGPTELFDASARQVCTVRPARTNTPLHSLILLNDITYVEAARNLAQRVLSEAVPTPGERITRAFCLATCRQPTAVERGILSARLQHLLHHYQADRDAALRVVSVGDSPRDPQLDIAELAAYTGLANMILNLDEVLTKE